MLYTRPQLAVLLVVVLVAGIGLGVGRWRSAYPEIAERLERFDRVVEPMKPTVDELPLAEPRRRPSSVPAHRDTPTTSAPAAKHASPSQPVDINRASEDELRALPGVGAVLASRIVEARERDGPFGSIDDLRRVRGFGRAKIEKLAGAIALGP
jgi:competence ComEA-like helix-hairpin-helix protein